jgi:hypothetical protein
MGTNPNREKTPNRNMGREMGRDDDDKPQDVNYQEIGSDPQVPNLTREALVQISSM